MAASTIIRRMICVRSNADHSGVRVLSLAVKQTLLKVQPRWLVTHCRSDQAEAVVKEIEEKVAAVTKQTLTKPS